MKKVFAIFLSAALLVAGSVLITGCGSGATWEDSVAAVEIDPRTHEVEPTALGGLGTFFGGLGQAGRSLGGGLAAVSPFKVAWWLPAGLFTAGVLARPWADEIFQWASNSFQGLANNVNSGFQGTGQGAPGMIVNQPVVPGQPFPAPNQSLYGGITPGIPNSNTVSSNFGGITAGIPRTGASFPVGGLSAAQMNNIVPPQIVYGSAFRGAQPGTVFGPQMAMANRGFADPMQFRNTPGAGFGGFPNVPFSSRYSRAPWQQQPVGRVGVGRFAVEVVPTSATDEDNKPQYSGLLGDCPTDSHPDHGLPCGLGLICVQMEVADELQAGKCFFDCTHTRDHYEGVDLCNQYVDENGDPLPTDLQPTCVGPTDLGKFFCYG